uniref:Exonuclease VII large subunit C-terminal domain-containing protein n=1 Tax=Thermocrinis ruber TaxID=75906 RepID=A0A7C5SYR0_9AQUI
MAESWLTPSDIAEKLVSHISAGFLLPIKVRGTVILDRQRGYYRLSDGKAGITLNIPPSVDLPVGAEVEVDGVLSANSFVKEDVALVYPAINVNSYRVLEEEKEKEFQRRISELEALLRGRNHFGFWETFTRLLGENERLRIGLIHGNSAQVWQDFIIAFRGAAGKHADKVEFVRFESSLSDGELAKTIEEVSKSGVHAVFLLRGGGPQEELARIGGFESLLAVIRLSIPFYTAIGHSFDRMVSLMEKVADGHFATPSIAGQELGKLVHMFSELESLKQEIRSKQVQIPTPSKPSLVWWVWLLAAAGIMLLFLLWRVGK